MNELNAVIKALEDNGEDTNTGWALDQLIRFRSKIKYIADNHYLTETGQLLKEVLHDKTVKQS